MVFPFSIGNALFLSSCFQNLSSVFSFQVVNYNVSWHRFLWVYPIWDYLSEPIHLCLLSNLGIFHPLFLLIFLQYFSLLSLFQRLQWNQSWSFCYSRTHQLMVCWTPVLFSFVPNKFGFRVEKVLIWAFCIYFTHIVSGKKKSWSVLTSFYSEWEPPHFILKNFFQLWSLERKTVLFSNSGSSWHFIFYLNYDCTWASVSWSYHTQWGVIS